jgi:hypothetical protein
LWFDTPMHFISVNIIRFVDDYFPGFVECEFYDADGHRHILIDKVPIFTDKMLDADSNYPIPGETACRVIKQFQDETNRHLACVRTIESTEGLSEFTVSASLLTSTENAPRLVES